MPIIFVYLKNNLNTSVSMNDITALICFKTSNRNCQLRETDGTIYLEINNFKLINVKITLAMNITLF